MSKLERSYLGPSIERIQRCREIAMPPWSSQCLPTNWKVSWDILLTNTFWTEPQHLEKLSEHSSLLTRSYCDCCHSVGNETRMIWPEDDRDQALTLQNKRHRGHDYGNRYQRQGNDQSMLNCGDLWNWAECTVPRGNTDKLSPGFMFDLDKQRVFTSVAQCYISSQRDRGSVVLSQLPEPRERWPHTVPTHLYC